MEQKVIVNRYYVQIGDRIILKNYWYKYVSYLIQMILFEEEGMLTEALGEDKYEQFFDWIELCVEESSGSESFKIEIPNEIGDLGNSIEKGIIGDEISWVFGEVECNLPKDKIKEWSNEYFKNLIIPYLQINISDTVGIEGEVSNTCELFRYYLKQNGYCCTEQLKSSDTISKITLDIVNTVGLVCIDEHEFTVETDLIGKLQVSVIIEMTTGDCVKQKESIYFPWYRKFDHITIDIINDEGRWLIKSKNLTRNFEYVSEIEIC